MAKSVKKTSAKAAKKPVAKAKSKPVAKAKKAAPAKPVKKIVAKKVAAKKLIAPKAVKKAAPKEQPVAKKVIEVAKKVIHKIEEKIEKVIEPKKTPAVKKKEKVAPEKEKETEKVAPAVAKPLPSQLNIFPNAPVQRPIAHKPAIKSTVSDDKKRYSEDELKEFEALINQKLEKARSEYKILKETLNRNNDEGTDSTSGGNTKVLEDGAETAEKENMSQLAARQQKYITNLENALIRIKNGTYGICSVTGKLIPKERLMAVPHTTQSIEAKIMQHD
jgi:RNA polymerase-binding transcription factor DksA